MPLATMTSKGQLALPKDVRDAMGWKSGGQLMVEVVDGVLVAKSQRQGPKAVDLFGLLGKPPRGEGLDTDGLDEAIGKAVAEHALSHR